MPMIALIILGNILFNDTTRATSDYGIILSSSQSQHSTAHSPGLEYTKLLHIQIMNTILVIVIHILYYISIYIYFFQSRLCVCVLRTSYYYLLSIILVMPCKGPTFLFSTNQ
jgi:hypothetical protein